MGAREAQRKVNECGKVYVSRARLEFLGMGKGVLHARSRRYGHLVVPDVRCRLGRAREAKWLDVH